MEIKVIKNILGKNEGQAERNRTQLAQKEILCINMMSSPGAGKTTLLEKTIDVLKERIPISVIEGDLMTTRDAQRISRCGGEVVQINTEGGCHLNAAMVKEAIEALEVKPASLLIIENVGNLVCPVAFDLGEDYKVVISSVPEGDDKPMKYPQMFMEANVCLLNKIDLIPYTNFDQQQFSNDIKTLNPDIVFFQVSALTGEGMEDWYTWLKDAWRWKTKK